MTIMTPARFLAIVESDAPTGAAPAASSHSDLWSAAVAKAEAEGEDSMAFDWIEVVAQTCNGGLQQVIENGRTEHWAGARAFLQGLPSCPQAKFMARLMGSTGIALREMEDAYLAYTKAYKHGEADGNDDPFGLNQEFMEAADTFEDWLYNHANIDPILQAYCGAPQA